MTLEFHTPSARRPNVGRLRGREFIVSGDSHGNVPVDLCETRLPKNMPDQALWEDTILDEPLVPGATPSSAPYARRGTRAGPCHATASSPTPTPDALPGEHP